MALSHFGPNESGQWIRESLDTVTVDRIYHPTQIRSRSRAAPPEQEDTITADFPGLAVLLVDCRLLRHHFPLLWSLLRIHCVGTHHHAIDPLSPQPYSASAPELPTGIRQTPTCRIDRMKAGSARDRHRQNILPNEKTLFSLYPLVCPLPPAIQT